MPPCKESKFDLPNPRCPEKGTEIGQPLITYYCDTRSFEVRAALTPTNNLTENSELVEPPLVKGPHLGGCCPDHLEDPSLPPLSVHTSMLKQLEKLPPYFTKKRPQAGIINNVQNRQKVPTLPN
ncbi:hypothetical protein E2320_002357 [Naja naja]|nr:hypothetical protein E2320_002357 [Naja naja]